MNLLERLNEAIKNAKRQKAWNKVTKTIDDKLSNLTATEIILRITTSYPFSKEDIKGYIDGKYRVNATAITTQTEPACRNDVEPLINYIFKIKQQ